MAKLSILAGATSQSVNVFIQDSSSTTGQGLAGLVYNTASLAAYYSFTGTSATATAISLATLAAVNSAYSSGGFKELQATNMKGVYRLDIPNAALAVSSGQSVTIILYGATNMAPCVLEIELTATNNQDGVRMGLTALPNAAAAASGGLWILGSNNTAAITIGALTTGAIACTTITASGAVAFQSTFAVTTSTALGALSCTTLTASGAVAFQSTFAVTTSTALGALSATTFATSGTTTFNAFTVTNNLTVSGTTTLTGAVSLGSTLGVTGTTTLAALTTTGTVTMNALTVSNATTLTGAVSLGSTLGITGTTTLAALALTTLTASGAVAFQSTFAVTGTTTLTGAVSLGSTLGVTGTVTFNAFTVTNNLTVSGTTTLTGAVSLGSTLGVTGTTTLAAVNTGAVGITTLTASGAVALQSTLVITGATTFTGAVTASNGANNIVGVTAILTAAYDAAKTAAQAGNQMALINGAITTSKIAVGAFDATVFATDAEAAFADAFLDRDMSTGTDSGSTTVRTPRQALRVLRNKAAIVAGTLTVTKEDDATASWTAAVTTTAGDPISSVDPAGP